jgi:putative ribosome biogenesis GTPase RsgA
LGIILFLTTIFSSIKRNEFKRVDNEINLKDISKVTFKEFRDDTIIAKIITRQKRVREITIDNNDNIAIQFMRKLKELNINVSLD